MVQDFDKFIRNAGRDEWGLAESLVEPVDETGPVSAQPVDSENISESDRRIIDTFRMKVFIAGLDLTEYVVGATCSRSLLEAAGTWTVYLRPIISKNYLLDLPIPINSYIEIRADRSTQGTVPKLLMRGLVTVVEMGENPSQSADGSPSRSFMISGNDMAKILQSRRIVIPPSVATGDMTAVQLKLGMYTDILAKQESVFQTFTQWNDFFVGRALKDDGVNINKSNGSPPFGIRARTIIPTIDGNSSDGEGSNELFVMLTAPLWQDFTGSLWNFMEFFVQRPFFEMFIEDTETETQIISRWVPFRGGDGEFPTRNFDNMPWVRDEAKPEVRAISPNTIVQRKLRRSDRDRFTYFWTQYGQHALGDVSNNLNLPDSFSTSFSNPYYDEMGTVQFGYKPLVTKVNFLSTRFKVMADPTTREDTAADLLEFLHMLNDWIVKVFYFTDALYAGTIVTKGNPDIKIGQEITITTPLSAERYYVESVEHSLEVHPTPKFLTKLGVTRGTGLTKIPSSDFTPSAYNNVIDIGIVQKGPNQVKTGSNSDPSNTSPQTEFE